MGRPGTAAHRFLPSLTGGGTDGNEQLTALTGAVLIVLLAVVGLTIVRIRQLIWPHLFVGLMLLGPVALKMASTGYKFARYYTGNLKYVSKGAPHIALRATAPFLVVSTVVVFASGFVLLFDGPGRRSVPLLVHKVSFIAWLCFFGIHLLGHVPQLPRSTGIAARHEGALTAAPGNAGRWISLASALVAGLVVAVVLLPHFGSWTAPGAFPHHHHHDLSG